MNPSAPLLGAGSLFVLLALVSPASHAAAGAEACDLLTSGGCMFVTAPATCSGECTAPGFTAYRDAQCTQGASASCSGTCQTKLPGGL